MKYKDLYLLKETMKSTRTDVKMTITWRFLILAINIPTFCGIEAYRPAGYLGCFLDRDGDSLIQPELLYKNNITGDYCKSMSISKLKRYAGTKNSRCFGGDDYKENRSSTGCTSKCPGNRNEICGDSNHIIIYDTWLCITRPCENGATCNDTNAKNFTCSCTEGWTGHFCNESVTSTATHSTESSSSFSWLSTTSVSTTRATGGTISKHTTIISIITPAATSEIIKTDTTAAANISWQNVNSSGQKSKSQLAIYISAPLVSVIAAIGVVTFLIIRKKRNQKNDDTSAIFIKSGEANHTCAFSNTAYNDQDIHSEIPVYANVTAEINANIKIVDTSEESETTKPDINREIPVDENGYGHLKSKTTAVLFDPTYSHTRNLQKNNACDNTYAHVDKATELLRSGDILNDADADDTYSHINKSRGKLKPDVNMNANDDTYNKLMDNGTKTSKYVKNTGMGKNEPEYDHT